MCSGIQHMQETCLSDLLVLSITAQFSPLGAGSAGFAVTDLPGVLEILRVRLDVCRHPSVAFDDIPGAFLSCDSAVMMPRPTLYMAWQGSAAGVHRSASEVARRC